MGFTGTHSIANINTGAKSQTQLNDHAGGQFQTVGNAVNNGQFQIQGNHQIQNFTNNGQANVLPRAFNPDGSPAAQLMELDIADLEDLASFNNIQQNGQMDFTGTHMVKNINTGAKSTTNFHDHKGGQFTTVMNANNTGKMNVSGNHVFDNTTNSGQFNAMPRTFNPDGSPAAILLDLAQFNSFSNTKGGNAQFTGEHAIKKLANEKGGKVAFMDHKSGKGSTVGETMNAGDMTASGNHMFDKTTNSGNFMAMPRTFDAKGNPVKLELVDLATFGNIVNKGGA